MKNKRLVASLIAGTVIFSATAEALLSNRLNNLFISKELKQERQIDPLLLLQNYKQVKALLSHCWLKENIKIIGWDEEKGAKVLDKYYSKIERMTNSIDKVRKSGASIRGEKICKIDPELPYADLRAFVSLCYLNQERFGVPATMFLAFYMKESHLHLDADGNNGAGGSQIVPIGAATVYLERNMSIINNRLTSAGYEPFPEELGYYWDSKRMEFNDTLKIVKSDPWKRNKDFVVDSLGNLLNAQDAPKGSDYDNLFSNNMKNPSISIVYTAAIFISKGFKPKKIDDEHSSLNINRLKTIADRYNTVYSTYHKDIVKYYLALEEIENINL